MAEWKTFVLLLTVLCLCVEGILGRATRESSHYEAVVVEFAPSGNVTSDPPLEVLASNWARYQRIIADVEGADIVVFPEVGLTGTHMPNDRKQLRPFLSRVPAPSEGPAPCDAPPSAAPSATDVLRNASCAARRHGLYLVLNLPEEAPCAGDPSCPPDGIFIHNTNVVFDRSGALVARYRKAHLFAEPAFDAGQAAPAVWETDFGVRFATFICFDVLFEEAAQLAARSGATDVAYPVAWFSELPFLTAAQTHAGWAHAANVTLLAAGLDRPQGSNGGSGVYWGEGGALKALLPTQPTTQALRVRVPKRTPPAPSPPPPPAPTPAPTPAFNLTLPPFIASSSYDALSFWQDDVRAWSSVLLPPAGGAFAATLCHGALCCRAEALTEPPPPNASADARYFYRFGVFDGVRNIAGERALGVQACGVFACTDPGDLAACGRAASGRAAGLRFRKLAVRAAGFEREHAVQMPSTLDAQTLLPLPAASFRFRRDVNCNCSSNASSNPNANGKGNAQGSTRAKGGAGAPGRVRAHLVATRDVDASLLAFAVYGRAFARDRRLDPAPSAPGPAPAATPANGP